MQLEKEEQRAGRNKDTSINSAYIRSGVFRKKFDFISDSHKLNRLLYELAKKMLFHRRGTRFEDMYWIRYDTLEVVASENKEDYVRAVKYSPKTKKAIKANGNLITIHSHPGSFPPSVEDLNSNYIHGYILGVVVGHNGSVFVYKSNELIEGRYFELKVDEYKKSGYNEYEARIKVLEYCCEHFDISFKEVTIE